MKSYQIVQKSQVQNRKIELKNMALNKKVGLKHLPSQCRKVIVGTKPGDIVPTTILLKKIKNPS